jgi:hypothetical protein
MTVTSTLAYYYAQLKMYLTSFRVNAQSICVLQCPYDTELITAVKSLILNPYGVSPNVGCLYNQARLEPTLEWSPIKGYTHVGSSMTANSRLAWK